MIGYSADKGKRVRKFSVGVFVVLTILGSVSHAGNKKLGITEAPSLLQGENWLKKQPPRYFTIQLLATRNSGGVMRFAKSEGLAGPLVHFVVLHSGREMHLLTQGSFPTRAAAEQWAKNLPLEIRPWIRRLDGIRPKVLSTAKPVEKMVSPGLGQDGGVKDMPWLWSQDPQAYTIQLAGGESRQAVEAMMQHLALPGERMVLRTRVNDRPWYSLIYGRFIDQGSARATIRRLPEILQQTKPWPRRFAGLHDEVSRSTGKR